MPPGQPDHRSTKGPVSHQWHHVARPQSTSEQQLEQAPHAQRPNPDNRTNDTQSSECVHNTAATLQFCEQSRPVVALRNAATHTVPTSSSQTIRDERFHGRPVSTVHCLASAASGLTVVVHRVAAPLGTPCSRRASSPQHHDWHPSLSPGST